MLANATPNDMELGSIIRSAIKAIEDKDSKKQEEVDPAQVSIFDEIKERQNEYRS